MLLDYFPTYVTLHLLGEILWGLMWFPCHFMYCSQILLDMKYSNLFPLNMSDVITLI